MIVLSQCKNGRGEFRHLIKSCNTGEEVNRANDVDDRQRGKQY